MIAVSQLEPSVIGYDTGVAAGVFTPACDVLPTPPTVGAEITPHTSFPLTITVQAVGSKSCHADVAISAHAFDVKPESQTFDLQANQKRVFTFHYFAT